VSQENSQIAHGARSVLRPLSQRASRRRSLDEVVLVRLPSLARLLSSALLRLPPRSRLRRSIVVRRIARAYAAGNRRDFDVVLVGMDLGIYEYRPSRDLLPPDLEEVFRGRDGYLQLWRYWLDAFEDIRWDPEEVLDFGDKLLVTTQQRGHGSGSGVGVTEAVFQLFTLRRGLVIRQEDFLNHAEALDAVGLREQNSS
jgi:SnoaL-like domain